MTNQPSYQFRQSARIKGGVDAQTVGETLAGLEEKHGGITPPMLVHESRAEEAPLHPCFTWDDAEAAELHRETEARSIVRSVRVIYPDTKESEPAFVHVRPMEGEEPRGPGFYANTREVVQRFSLYESAWRDARDRLNSAAKALEDLERVARGQINDQAVARVDAAKAAISHVANAAEVLEAVK
jgi:hypothetical protein